MKKILSVLLCILLSFSCAVPALAAEPKTCNCGSYPIIVVSGVGAMPYMINAGTEDEAVYFPPNVNVGKIVTRAIGGTLRAVVTLRFSYFADAVVDIAMDILGKFGCDENGLPAYPVTHVTRDLAMSEYDPSLYKEAEDAEFSILNAAVKAVGADHAYFYNYDWRLDPMQNADTMDAFIDRVLLETGHDKVRLAACSMGGVQTTTYFGKYGHDKVDTVWMLSAAFCGLQFVTNLFAGELIVDQYNFFQWLKTYETGKPSTDRFLGKLLDFCSKTALLRPMFRLTDRLTERLNGVIINRVLKSTILSMPGMWSFVQDERYEEAKKEMLSDASPTFIGMLDSYHYEIYQNREKILRDAKNDGVKIHVISHYNNGCVPITSSGNAHGDSLIETTGTSGGATVADFGKTLGKDYVQKACPEHNHLSADGVIDASTCMFPDSTWFIKNMAHVGCKKGSAYNEMLFWMFSQNDQLTVFDNASYPQFLVTEPASQMTLEPLS